MPLLRKKPFVCETPPAHLTANDLVFYCKFTGEAFTDYELVILGVTLCYFITARRYASAVLAVVVCPSVCLSVCPSVCHKPVLYRNGNT